MLDNPKNVSRWRGTASIPHFNQQAEEKPMRKSLAVFLSGVALVIAASTALAGEQVLEFKLIAKPIDVKVTEAANVEGQTVVSGKFFGVTVFKDGRIGVKEFVHSATRSKARDPSTATAPTRSRMARSRRVTPARSKTAGQTANIRSSPARAPMRTLRARAPSKARRTRSRASTS